MAIPKRTQRINKKKSLEQGLGTDPRALPYLLDIAGENAGTKIRKYVHQRLREIVAANPDRPEILIDTKEILDTLTEARLRRERLLKFKREKPTVPFTVPLEFKDKFRWAYQFTKSGEIKWQLIQV